jgi:hypothetical protein
MKIQNEKKCNQCEKDKPLTEFYSGYRNCKECHIENVKNHRSKYSKHYKNYRTLYEKENRERIREYVRNRYADNPEVREHQKAYSKEYLKDPDNRKRIIEQQRQYRIKNHKNIRLKSRERYANDPEFREKHKKQALERYYRNRKQILKQQKARRSKQFA